MPVPVRSASDPAREVASCGAAARTASARLMTDGAAEPVAARRGAWGPADVAPGAVLEVGDSGASLRALGALGSTAGRKRVVWASLPPVGFVGRRRPRATRSSASYTGSPFTARWLDEAGTGAGQSARVRPVRGRERGAVSRDGLDASRASLAPRSLPEVGSTSGVSVVGTVDAGRDGDAVGRTEDCGVGFVPDFRCWVSVTARSRALSSRRVRGRSDVGRVSWS